MLRLTLFEFIVRGLPESFVLMLAAYGFSNTKLNLKRYIISSLLLAICEYSVRMLPIYYGINTILNIFIIIIIACNISKIEIISSIKVSLIATIGLFILEVLNMLLVSNIFKERFDEMNSNIVLKQLYGLPSLICFAIITIIFYLRKKDNVKYV